MTLETETNGLRQTFKKEERLFEKKLIDRLFKEGNNFFQFPFKVIYLRLDEPAVYPAKILISVPKRNFKRAVDRNRIKRLIREAYRKNKFILNTTEQKEEKSKLVVIGFIYTARRLVSYIEIEKKIIIALQQLKQEYE